MLAITALYFATPRFTKFIFCSLYSLTATSGHWPPEYFGIARTMPPPSFSPDTNLPRQ